MRKLYLLVLLANVLCYFGCKPESDENPDSERDVHWSPSQPLNNEQIIKIGRDGGSGKSGGGFYDVDKPIDRERPVMPTKKPGVLKDGVYRLRWTNYEGAERTVRGAQGEKYNKLLSQELDRKKSFGVIQVSDHGKRIVEWRFEDENNLTTDKFESDGQGSLKSKQVLPCTLAYFTDKKDVKWSTKDGAFEIVAYCPKHPGDEYERNGIIDHHELWTYTYEPYEKSF